MIVKGSKMEQCGEPNFRTTPGLYNAIFTCTVLKNLNLLPASFHRDPYTTLAHAFNDRDDAALKCYLSKNKTPKAWDADGLKVEPTGYKLTGPVVKSKLTEMQATYTQALAKMRM